MRNAQGGLELISNVCRHRQAVMLKGKGSLQTQQKGSAGGTSCARCTAGLTAPGRIAGRAAFAHDPCLNLNNYKLRRWNGLLFEDNGRDVAADLAQMARADLSFDGWCSTTWNCTSATTTGRPSSRSIWRTTTSALPPRFGQLCDLRRPALGSSARVFGADRGRGPTAWAKARPVYERWHEGAAGVP